MNQITTMSVAVNLEPLGPSRVWGSCPDGNPVFQAGSLYVYSSLLHEMRLYDPSKCAHNNLDCILRSRASVCQPSGPWTAQRPVQLSPDWSADVPLLPEWKKH